MATAARDARVAHLKQTMKELLALINRAMRVMEHPGFANPKMRAKLPFSIDVLHETVYRPLYTNVGALFFYEEIDFSKDETVLSLDAVLRRMFLMSAPSWAHETESNDAQRDDAVPRRGRPAPDKPVKKRAKVDEDDEEELESLPPQKHTA